MAIQFRDIFQFDSIMAGIHVCSKGKKSADICSSLVMHIANSRTHTQFFFLTFSFVSTSSSHEQIFLSHLCQFHAFLILTFNFKYSLTLTFCSYIYFICFPRWIFVFLFFFSRSSSKWITYFRSLSFINLTPFSITMDIIFRFSFIQS